MKIDIAECIGCEACHPYCPVGAISSDPTGQSPVSAIDPDACVECSACRRADVCPTDAIYMPALTWPRSVRAFFSDPTTTHPSTKLEGRGTEEMKTNDVTGRIPQGVAGLAVEMGRPGMGTTFTDIQTVTKALAGAGVRFESGNPTGALIADKTRGMLDPEVMGERVLSAIIEFTVDQQVLTDVLAVLKEVSCRIDTVFSLGLISRPAKDGSVPVVDIAADAGFTIRPNGKINVGLGRPLKEDA